jgi:hypothetical protein
MVIPAACALGCPGSSIALATALVTVELARAEDGMDALVESAVLAMDYSTGLTGEVLGTPDLTFRMLGRDML